MLLFLLLFFLLWSCNRQLLDGVEHGQLCFFNCYFCLLLFVHEQRKLVVNLMGLAIDIFNLFLYLPDFLFEIGPLHRFHFPTSASYFFDWPCRNHRESTITHLVRYLLALFKLFPFADQLHFFNKSSMC